MSGLLAYIGDNLGLIWQRAVEHVALSGASLALAMLLALPLALWLGHTGRGGFLAVNASNIGRALPSLAIIAIFVSLPRFGLSNLSTVAALIALGIPPMLTNAYTGVREVDRDVVEAARGMGMTEGGILRKVELPLAAPVIVAGIRTSAVQIVATATLAAVIAGGGLGRFITDGFAIGDDAQVLTGAIAVALLAVATEVGLGLVERAVTPRGLVVGRAAAGRPEAPLPGPADAVVREV